MTPEEKKVIQSAIYLRYCMDAGTAGDPPRLGKLLDAVDALMVTCTECNAGGHTCPGDGLSIAHGETDCGAHDDTITQHTWPCIDCTALDEDPRPWCDCRAVDGEQCPRTMACRARAHDPERCANAPVPEWVVTEWRFVRDRDRVRIGQHEADVETATCSTWYVDPKSSEYRPVSWTHEKCRVRLAGRPMMEFPPHGSIEILMDVERKAIHTLVMAYGSVTEIGATEA